MTSRIRVTTFALFLVVVIPGGDSTAVAQTPSDLASLRRRVESRFRVVPFDNRLVLVPSERSAPVAFIELVGDRVSIDGQAVTGEQLRTRLGADADLILRLSFVDAETRHELFRQRAPEIEVEKGPGQPERLEPRYRRSGAKVRIGGNVTVEPDEWVRDAVLVVFGSALISGRVWDDVVAVFGDVTLYPGSEVTGDVTVIGGTVDRKPGAVVLGQINEVGFGISPIRIRGPDLDMMWIRDRWFPGLTLFGTLIRISVLGLLAVLVLLVAPGPVERICREAADRPWKAGLVGLLAQLLFVPSLVASAIVLVISIVGIPLLAALPVVVLAFAVALLAGFTAVGCSIGRWMFSRAGGGDAARVGALLVGLALVWSLTVAGRVAGLAGPAARPLVAMILLAGFLVEYVVWTIGLGAVLLTRFGSR